MIRRLAVLALALAVPTLASAQYRPYRPRASQYGPPLSGPTLSVWLGVGVPSGDISDEGDGGLGDVVDFGVPIGVAAGYRFNPLFRAAFFFEGVPLGISDSVCAPGDSCNGSDLRVGVETQLHLAPFHRVDPWVGLGVGYEWLRFDATGCNATGFCFGERFHYDGWIFPRISAGLDVPISPFVRIGPYLTYSAGEYTTVDTSGSGSQDIHDRSFHGWLEIGVRGDFDL